MAIVFAAGETVTAGKLNRLQPVTYRAAGSGTVAPSSINAAVTGATVTFSTAAANSIALVRGYFEADVTAGGTGQILGKCFVDGVEQTGTAQHIGNANTDVAGTSKEWRVTLATAGSHTIDLRGTTNANAGIVGGQCVIVIVVYEQN